MNKAKKDYKKKVKRLGVYFYLKDEALYEFAKCLNFNKFVKDKLNDELKAMYAEGEK